MDYALELNTGKTPKKFGANRVGDKKPTEEKEDKKPEVSNKEKLQTSEQNAILNFLTSGSIDPDDPNFNNIYEVMASKDKYLKGATTEGVLSKSIQVRVNIDFHKYLKRTLKKEDESIISDIVREYLFEKYVTNEQKAKWLEERFNV